MRYFLKTLYRPGSAGCVRAPRAGPLKVTLEAGPRATSTGKRKETEVASLTRNQWIAILVPIIAALIGAAALLLQGAGGPENNCRDEAQCGGRDVVRVENPR